MATGVIESAAARLSYDWKLIISLPITFAFCLSIYRIFFHPLSHIPGPFLAKLTGHWRNYKYASGQWHVEILKIHREYGPIVRVAPGELSLVDEHACKMLYGHGHNCDKTNWYATWDIPGTAPGLFAERNRKTHSFLRKRVSSAYSMSAILGMEQYIQACLDILLQKLKKYVDQSQIVDMSAWTSAMAFDVVGELGYGSSLQHVEKESDVLGIRKAIYDGFWAMGVTGHLPGQASLFTNAITRKLRSMIGADDLFADFQRWSVSKVEARKNAKEPSERTDMLAHFLKMRKVNGDPADFGEVLIEAMNIIGAGANTTSIAMRSCLYYVCTHSDVYSKIQQEVDDYYESHRLEEPIRYNQTQELPYLVAASKEAMRLHPSITWQLLRYAPAGLVVNGKAIPEHTCVGVSPLAHNRDKKVWGEDADHFRPERWLESVAKTNYLNSNNMTFGGSGPRTCIGRNIALVEVHKFLAQLLYYFDVSFVDPKNPWRIETFWFSFQHDMKMNIKSRTGRAPRVVSTAY